MREAGVYSEIVPFDKAEAALQPVLPKAIILSGGPAIVHETGTPQAPPAVFNAGVPVLGICYGEQAMVAALGGQVEGGHTREFGRAELQIIDETPLFDGVLQIGERGAGVDEPWRPRDAAAAAASAPSASRPARRSRPSPTIRAGSTACSSTPRWCTRRKARRCIANFVHGIAGCAGDWTMAQFRASEVARIREQVGRRPRDLRPVGRRRLRPSRRS